MPEGQHAAPPMLCTQCLEAFFSALAPVLDDRIVFAHCPHGGGALLRAQIRGGCVENWLFRGPITADQAADAVAAEGLVLKRAGLLREPPPAGDVH